MTFRTLGRGFWLGISASLLLHFLLFSSGQFQIPRWNDKTVLEARLEPAEFKAVALPEPSVSAQAATIAPKPVTGAAKPPPATASVEPAPIVSPPPPPQTEPAATPPAAIPSPAIPPTNDQPQTAPSQASNHLKTLPARIEIVFELNGMLSGRQTHRWHRDGQRYSLETEGEVTGLAGLFMRGKLKQTSQGRIGNMGLMPARYEMFGLTGKTEALQFDYEDNLIESSRSNSKSAKRHIELPLLTGAQDPLSSIYQLAMMAAENGEGVIVAASAKRIKGYPYRVLGMEKLDTALGTLSALHVVRAGDSGNSDMHLWLSPGHYYLPVKVTYVDGDGTEWVLEATRIKAE